MTSNCPKPGCTIAATGICLLNVKPAADCPVLKGEASPEIDELPSTGEAVSLSAEAEAGAAMEATPPIEKSSAPASPTGVGDLAPPVPAKTRLRPGRELGLDGLSDLARQRPVRLVGLLGAPDAGKTMALVSMFLLTAQGKLKGYEYRNSESAFAFDELSKGARAWTADGDMLEQVVPHTELADERRPGFLHLRLHGERVGTAVDLAFPDLPGEWTDTLINKDVYDRLAFLQNADAIWIFVDGKKLSDLNYGHDISARTCSLIGRLAKHLPKSVPLTLVITRADQFAEVPAAVLNPIKEEAADKGFDLHVQPVVSIDRTRKGRSGEGIPELLDRTITVASLGASIEPANSVSFRHMHRYRKPAA